MSERTKKLQRLVKSIQTSQTLATVLTDDSVYTKLQEAELFALQSLNMSLKADRSVRSNG